MLTKTSGYFDSLHVDQEERQTETDQVREQITHKNRTMRTKTSGYLDSLHVDQDQRQRQNKPGNKSYTKTAHNADKDQWLP